MTTTRQSSLLEQLCAGAPVPVVMIVAHPDDEVIGAGGQLGRWNIQKIVYVTDGAPRNGRDALAHGLPSVAQYAVTRRLEAEAALACAGLNADAQCWLGVPDQEASFHMRFLIRTFANLSSELQPAAIITHAYEGGHPDHDTVCFAVHMACRSLTALGLPVPQVVEMTSYHKSEGGFAAGCFLNRGPSQTIARALSAADQIRKRALFDCYKTQADVLKAFSVDCEEFRAAPEYDFTAPPHAGTLYYELFDWGMTGEKWRTLATEALSQLSSFPSSWAAPVLASPIGNQPEEADELRV